MGGILPNSRLSLALVHSSTNMLKSVWASDFWKPLVHTNMSKILENIRSFSHISTTFQPLLFTFEETNKIAIKYIVSEPY